MLEYASISVTCVYLTLCTLLAYQNSSSTSLGTVMNNLVQILSFLLVMWRYMGPADIFKEKKCLLALSSLFIISAFISAFKSISQLAMKLLTYSTYSLIAVNAIQSLIYLVLAGFKLWILRKVGRLDGYYSLLADAVNTIVCALYCLESCVSMWVYLTNPDCWYLEAVFEMLFVIFLLAFGIFLIYKRNQAPKE